MRHIYQFAEIDLLLQGKIPHEEVETVRIWEYEFENYIRNEDAESQQKNLLQEIEQDANGYGLALLNLYYIKYKNVIFHYSLPEEAHRLADLRSRKYYYEKPELRSYLEKNKQRQ